MINLRHYLALFLVLMLPSFSMAEFKYWNPKDTGTIPKTLSAMGLYSYIAGGIKVMTPNVQQFDVNSPLWSDDAKKTRWVLVPKGKSIEFDEKNDVWKFPDSTVFIKQFAIDTVTGDSTSRILWETRILINIKEVVDPVGKKPQDIWYATTYKWNTDQKDAVLIDSKFGKNDTIRIYPNGKGNGSRIKKWRYPSSSDCKLCHQLGPAYSDNDSSRGRAILGFFTAQLNRPDPQRPLVNQLQNLFDKGILSGSHSSDWNADNVPRWSSLSNTAASLDKRARSYIAANCSGCHGRRGIGIGATQGVELNYDFHNMVPQMEFRYKGTKDFGLDSLAPFFYNRKTDSIANPKHLNNLKIESALIVPGYPEKSVLWHRMTFRNPLDTSRGGFIVPFASMPPLGSYEVDSTARAIIAQWITEMTPLDQTPSVRIQTKGKPTLLKSPTIKGNTLFLPPELADQNKLNVSLTDIDGRTLYLNKMSTGAYAIPKALPTGIYIIRLGNRSYIRNIFPECFEFFSD